MQQIENSKTISERQRSSELVDESNDQYYVTDGAIGRVPGEFSFPECNEPMLWQLWCRGNEELRFPPFKDLTPTDMLASNNKKRLCDVINLMSIIEDKARELGIYNPNPSALEASGIYEACKKELPSFALRGKRRFNQLSWRTVVNLSRKRRRLLDGA